MDDGSDIDIGDTITVQELITHNTQTQGRLEFEIDPSGKYAVVSFVNYYRTEAGNRSKNADGAWKLLPRVNKKVALI